MSREVTVSEEPGPKTITTYGERITCDKCGRVIDPEFPPDDDEDLYAQVLEIYLNLDQCVNDRVKMDLCRACLTPIWAQICAAIGADPEDELRIGQDD
jgi:hypothetical protein